MATITIEIIPRLKESYTDLISLISSLNQQQLNKIPFEGSWTPAQVGDHIYKCNHIIEILTGNVKETKRAADEKVKEQEEIFLNFEIKMDAPIAVLPATGFIEKDELLERTKKETSELLEFAKNQDLSLTCTDIEFPGNGMMTRLEWLHFSDVHTRRHIHQIKNMLIYL